jgi:hypothetical protein
VEKIALYLVILAVSLASAYGFGRSHANQAHKAALADQLVAARRTEHGMQEKVDAARIQAQTEKVLIVAERDRALASLRNRPERLPEAARAACSGSTGAELSRGDAEDLVRLAARADELRNYITELEAWVETAQAGRASK